VTNEKVLNQHVDRARRLLLKFSGCQTAVSVSLPRAQSRKSGFTPELF
jgi:hypothetical protein